MSTFITNKHNSINLVTDILVPPSPPKDPTAEGAEAQKNYVCCGCFFKEWIRCYKESWAPKKWPIVDDKAESEKGEIVSDNAVIAFE